jgi:excinuclease ABC subunit C
VVPPQNDPVLLLLMRIRDEAHRFALSYHRMRRAKQFTGRT